MSELMTERSHAAEVRSFTVRDFLLRRYARLAEHIRERKLGLARLQTLTRIYGDALKGAATVVMYATLGSCCGRASCRWRSPGRRCWRSAPASTR